jgi:hypothetical protein
MSEPKEDAVQQNKSDEFAPSTFPTVFADGVLSFTIGQQIVRFYLFRTDPNMFGKGGGKTNPFAQVIMPTVGFLQSMMFLQQQLERMVEAGIYTKEDVENARALFQPPKKSETGDAG